MPHERLVLDLRTFGIREALMLGRYQYRHAHPGLFPHSHRDSLEICFLAKGRQLYRVGRKDYVLTGGDVFVTFPDETHSTGESPEEKGCLYWLILNLSRSSGRFLNCAPLDGRKLKKQLLDMPHRHFAGEPALNSLLERILFASRKSENPLQRVTIQNALLEFLIRIIACSQREPRPAVSLKFSDLLRYIETNVHQTLPIAALAARMGLSLPRFKARFKKEVGMPPAEYVLRRKIEAAKKRLARPGTSVTHVAMDLNFSSSQYFATVFRRYTGCSPRELREKAG